MRKLKCKEVRDLTESPGVEAGFAFRDRDPESMFLNDVVYCLWVEGHHLEGRNLAAAILLTFPTCQSFALSGLAPLPNTEQEVADVAGGPCSMAPALNLALPFTSWVTLLL